jgi:DNA modification methylase
MVDKKIDIKFKKTCDCPDNHINCLTAKEWIKYQLGVWQFYYEKRDIRDKNKHPATFPISLVKRIIELFTHKGELVLDPFNGSGTTLLAAKDVDRNAIGFDINEEYCNLSKNRLSQESLTNNSSQIVVCDDARNINEYLNKNIVSLSVTSPPYANLLNRKRKNKSRRGDTRKNGQYLKVEQYSQNKNDLGILNMEDFEIQISKIYEKMLPIIKPGGHVVINIADMWWEGNRIPLHISIIRALEKAGYIFRNTIIWDRTNIVNQIGIFGWPSNYITMGTTFEYVLDFIKSK